MTKTQTSSRETQNLSIFFYNSYDDKKGYHIFFIPLRILTIKIHVIYYWFLRLIFTSRLHTILLHYRRD